MAMSDIVQTPSHPDKRRGMVVRAVIISGWVLTLVTMVALMGSAMWLLLEGRPVPEELRQWSGIALGFLFGTFTSIVRDYIAQD